MLLKETNQRERGVMMWSYSFHPEISQTSLSVYSTGSAVERPGNKLVRVITSIIAAIKRCSLTSLSLKTLIIRLLQKR